MLDQSNMSAIACRTNFLLAYLAVSRSSRWNCLLTPANLTQVPQTPLPGVVGNSSTINAVDWAPLTFYSADSYVTYGGYYYMVMFDYTSTNNFTNDLTTGALTQTDTQTASTNFNGLDGCAYASGWTYQYALPADFQLLAVLNSCACWDFYGAGGDDYQLMGGYLYCEQEQAVIQYVKNQPDCTQWDSLFADAFTYKLAAAISTNLRQDGGKMEALMMQSYQRSVREARAKNGNEGQERRFNPIRSSRFIQSRLGGVNG